MARVNAWVWTYMSRHKNWRALHYHSNTHQKASIIEKAKWFRPLIQASLSGATQSYHNKYMKRVTTLIEMEATNGQHHEPIHNTYQNWAIYCWCKMNSQATIAKCAKPLKWHHCSKADQLHGLHWLHWVFSILEWYFILTNIVIYSICGFVPFMTIETSQHYDSMWKCLLFSMWNLT